MYRTCTCTGTCMSTYRTYIVIQDAYTRVLIGAINLASTVWPQDLNIKGMRYYKLLHYEVNYVTSCVQELTWTCEPTHIVGRLDWAILTAQAMASATS